MCLARRRAVGAEARAWCEPPAKLAAWFHDYFKELIFIVFFEWHGLNAANYVGLRKAVTLARVSEYDDSGRPRWQMRAEGAAWVPLATLRTSLGRIGTLGQSHDLILRRLQLKRCAACLAVWCLFSVGETRDVLKTLWSTHTCEDVCVNVCFWRVCLSGHTAPSPADIVSFFVHSGCRVSWGVYLM